MDISAGKLISHDVDGSAGKDSSVFALSNGVIGIRGVLEEAGLCSETALFAGFYDKEKIIYGEPAFGYPEYNEFIAWAPNALGFQIYTNGSKIGPDTCAVTDFEKELDLEKGVFSHRYLVKLSDGKQLKVEFRRCVPLFCTDLLLISCKITPCGGAVPLNIRTYLTVGESKSEEISDPRKCSVSQNSEILFETDGELLLCTKTLQNADNSVTAAARCISNGRFLNAEHCKGGVCAAYAFDGSAELTKFVVYSKCRPDAVAALNKYLSCDPEAIFRSHSAILREKYRIAGVEIKSEPIGALVKYSVFQLIMAGPSDAGHSIPAKGLSGNGYSGHVFWDTEIYLFPFYLYNFPDVAKNLIRFRYNTLGQARDRAAELSYRGALFPWRTVSGRECSAYFPSGTAEFHIDGDIAYAADRYISVTNDIDFLKECVLELLLETARFYLSLGFFNDSGDFCINGVTGPDEYSAMVNNNLYTNLIAKYNFLNFLKWLKYLEETDFAEYSAFLCKHHVEADELNSFRRAASCMKLCKKGDLLLQDEDILNREALDLSSIPAENFPLLLHYHPLYIYQKRVCKQADAVLAMMLFPDEFTEKEKAVSYAFYQGITTHDSSLSEGVFSVVGIDLNRPESAQAFLEQSLRLDIDDLHHNTEDGLHFANIGLAWLTVVRGFFGFQFRNGAAHFSPKITEFLGDCSFNLQLGQSRINVRYSRDVLHICLLEGAPLTLWVYGKKYRLDSHPVNVQL